MSKANNRAAADTFGCRSWRFKKKLLPLPTGRDNARVTNEFLTLRSSLFTYEHNRETTENCFLCLRKKNGKAGDMRREKSQL